MQAVILVGGLGTRLRVVAGEAQKCLVPVRGRPFLSYIFDQLLGGGVTDVVLLIGHSGEAVQRYCGDGTRMGLSITYSVDHPDGALMGTGGALKRAESLLAHEFLLMNGDTYLPFEVAALMADWRAMTSDMLGLMAVHDEQREQSGVMANVSVDDHGMIIGHQKGGGEPAYRYGDAGVALYRSSVLQWIPSDQTVSIEESVVATLVSRGCLRAWSTPSRFFDIGTPEGLVAFEHSLG